MSLSPGKGSTLYSAPLGGGIPLALPPNPSPIPGQSGPRPLWLDPGTYIVDNGGGGTDIRPFTATLTLPDAFVWTNMHPDLTINRSADLDIQWTGGDPNAMVVIQGISSAASGASGSFSCIVPNTGEFVVTSDVLNLLPASAPNTLFVSSSLNVQTAGAASFSAAGLDIGQLGYVYSYSVQVVYQ